MHGLRESAMAPFNKGHLLSGGGIGVGYSVFIEINEYNISWKSRSRASLCIPSRDTSNDEIASGIS